LSLFFVDQSTLASDNLVFKGLAREIVIIKTVDGVRRVNKSMKTGRH